MPPVATRKRCLDFSGDGMEADLNTFISNLFQEAGIQSTQTKAGWCLREGMAHILAANESVIASVVKQEGAPRIYETKKCRHDEIQQYKPQNCFQSLCRIVAGQQLAGSAATAIWLRFVATTKDNVTPIIVLQLAKIGLETHLQQPSGLSRAKARCIVALSEAFATGTLTESFLTSSSEGKVRKALLGIKGIGPWSCDMFLMFYLERPDVFPIGDLAVRKGIAKLFSLRGKGSKGSLCPKKDLEVMERAMQPYQPFCSIATYYMWRIVDAKDVYDKNDTKKQKTKDAVVEPNVTKTPT